MTQPRDLDPIIATWLDDGPIDLPEETRRAIAVGVRTQPRMRRMANLRGLSVNTLTRLATAAGIVLAVGAVSMLALANRGGGPGGLPTASPTPSASPAGTASPSPSVAPTASAISTANWVTFTSTRYAYTMRYPPSWQAEQAARQWTFADRLTTPLTSADHFIDPRATYQIGISGWFADVPVGTSEDAWLTSYYANPDTLPANCGVSIGSFVPITIDGRRGRMASSNCSDSQAFVFVGSRVYIFGVWRDGQEALLQAFVSTVKLSP
jgi:hypothetical protein